MPYFIFDQSDVLFLGSDLTIKKEFSQKFNSSITFNYLWSKKFREEWETNKSTSDKN